MLNWNRIFAILSCTFALGACGYDPVLAYGPIPSPKGDLVYRIMYTEPRNGRERLEVCTPDLHRCQVVVQTTEQSTIAARWMPQHKKWQFAELEVVLNGPVFRPRTAGKRPLGFEAYIAQCPICGDPACTEAANALLRAAIVERDRHPIDVNKERYC